MALHLVYGIKNLKNFDIINKVNRRFEPNWVNLVFKPTFTSEILCNMITTCIIL